MGNLSDRFTPAKRLWAIFIALVLYVSQKDLFDNLYGAFTGGNSPPDWLEHRGIRIIGILELWLIAALLFSLVWPFIAYGIWRFFDRIPSPFVGRPENHLYKVHGKYTSFNGRQYKLQEEEMLITREFFTPPVTFSFSAKTDSTDLRFGYIGTDCILRWKLDKNELRIGCRPADKTSGPFDGHHKPNMGFIEKNQWASVDVIVKEDSYTIRVNGATRFFERANLSGFCQPFLIRQGEYSIVRVRSLLIEKLRKADLPRGPQFDPKDIVYAEWGATAEQDGAYYAVNITLGGQPLSEKVQTLFKFPPEKLLSSTLNVRDPVTGPHKQLKLKVADGKFFSLDEYSRITVDSAISISPFEPIDTGTAPSPNLGPYLGQIT